MKVAVLFSGGKDSTMALYNALETGEDVKYLLSMKSVNDAIINNTPAIGYFISTTIISFINNWGIFIPASSNGNTNKIKINIVNIILENVILFGKFILPPTIQ